MKRTPKVVRESTVQPSVCLLTIDKETGGINLNDNITNSDGHDNENPIPENMKIRTESIDETRQKFEN